MTLLAGDRLSQVTRRGMLTKTPPKREQRGAFLNQTYFTGGAAEKKIQGELPKVEGRKEVDTSEPHRPQRLQQSELVSLFFVLLLQMVIDGVEIVFTVFSLLLIWQVLTVLMGEEEYGASGVSGMTWLDNFSESADSCLSKIDWAAVERMAAAEEAAMDSNSVSQEE